ncbi:YoaK family protein [Jeongeupia wiesaeckerbachi]|uniref:YoaK family protein n=1 Tax=Jeongeupia wiesaeckerbachi TaxID=3051218 RepID=UPI003D808520
MNWMHRLVGRERTLDADQKLGLSLAFVAGAANAGGFLAVGQYTSHMSGIVSTMADQLILGDLRLVLAGFGAFVCFTAGAATSSLLINWARRRRMHSEYALSLLVEAILMLGFGLLGGWLSTHAGFILPFTVMWLCYLMGLQNAIVTKLSSRRIRTTHVTGLVTDIGIELGRLLYWHRHDRPDLPRVVADRTLLALNLGLLLLFLTGGIAGAWAFQRVGFVATVPLALLLLLLAAMPVWEDVQIRSRLLRLRHGRR